MDACCGCCRLDVVWCVCESAYDDLHISGSSGALASASLHVDSCTAHQAGEWFGKHMISCYIFFLLSAMGAVRQGSTWGLRAGVSCAIAVTARHLKVLSTRVAVHCSKRGIASSHFFFCSAVPALRAALWPLLRFGNTCTKVLGGPLNSPAPSDLQARCTLSVIFEHAVVGFCLGPLSYSVCVNATREAPFHRPR